MADIELDIGNRSVTDDEEETEALTAAEVLQKLEDVSIPRRMVGGSTIGPRAARPKTTRPEIQLGPIPETTRHVYLYISHY